MNFPIIILSKGDNRIYAYTENEFGYASLGLLDVYTDAMILDSKGIMYDVANAYQTGWGNMFFGYSLLMKGRSIKFKLNIRSQDQISLETFQDLLIERLNRNHTSGFWYSKRDIPRMKDAIIESKAYKDIIGIFLYGIEANSEE